MEEVNWAPWREKTEKTETLKNEKQEESDRGQGQRTKDRWTEDYADEIKIWDRQIGKWKTRQDMKKGGIKIRAKYREMLRRSLIWAGISEVDMEPYKRKRGANESCMGSAENPAMRETVLMMSTHSDSAPYHTYSMVNIRHGVP